VKDVIEKRKSLADEAFVRADAKAAEAEAARERFEAQSAALAQERQDLLRKIHQEIEGERSETLEAARREAESMIEEARETTKKERARTVRELRDQVAEMAVDLAADLLSKTGAVSADEFLADLADRQLSAMSEADRNRLREDLAANDACLRVVTAKPIARQQQTQWKKRLGGHLGHEERIEFTVAPGILGGLELRFPHNVIRFTWADQLRRAKELIRGDDTPS